MKKRDFSTAEAAIIRSRDECESVRANADDLINIHEPGSSIILSAFYMVINRICGSFFILSVLFVGFFPFFIEKLNDKQYLKHHHQS